MTPIRNRLHFELSGPASGPPVVFSHALGGDLSMWKGQARALADSGYRVLCFDTAGHGKSAIPAGPLTLADLGNDVLELLDSQTVARVHFCGLSLGGMIGQWLALHAADRLASLTLADTAPQIGTAQMWNERLESIQKNGLGALAASTMERWFTQSFREREPETVTRFQAILSATSPLGYAACAAVVRDGVLPPEQMEKLNGIRTPTLVITGKYDAATPPADVKAMALRIPGARYVELEAAHISCVEQADEFTSVLTGFLV